ncbi:MAG: DUF6464 family protein [Snowella sp.]|nr:DUF6464 family protein [Snowella sp.]
MIEFILLLLAAVLPALLSFFLIRRAKRRFNEQMRRIRVLNHYRRRIHRDSHFLPIPDETYQDAIGDISCRNNAKSPYLRCAINPSGPCEDCSHYEKRP